MQLVVKLYSDKPSRIGIKHTYEYQAVREYEQLMNKMPGYTCRLNFELVNGRLLLTVVSDHSGIKVVYKEVEFNAEQLRRLLAHYSPHSEFLFVNVFPRANTLMVAKPFRKQEFLRVTDIALSGTLHTTI